MPGQVISGQFRRSRSARGDGLVASRRLKGLQTASTSRDDESTATRVNSPLLTSEVVLTCSLASSNSSCTRAVGPLEPTKSLPRTRAPAARLKALDIRLFPVPDSPVMAIKPRPSCGSHSSHGDVLSQNIARSKYAIVCRERQIPTKIRFRLSRI